MLPFFSNLISVNPLPDAGTVETPFIANSLAMHGSN
jgi:hypothetical protein